VAENDFFREARPLELSGVGMCRVFLPKCSILSFGWGTIFGVGSLVFCAAWRNGGTDLGWKWGWRQFLRVLVLGALGFMAVQIWLFSSETASLSAERSQQWLAFLNLWARRFHLNVQLTGDSVRKLAHFAEFTALGFLAQLSFGVVNRLNGHTALHGLFLGLLVAVADETLQLFVDGRGSSVRDVVIDFCGVLAGSSVLWLLAGLWALLFGLRRRRRAGDRF
nr:VanZ family protein [Clostridia bacterium]